MPEAHVGREQLIRPGRLYVMHAVTSFRSAMHTASNESGDGMPSRCISAFRALYHLPWPSILQGIRLP